MDSDFSKFIIYAQEGIVDCRTPARTPWFIEFQHEVRAAVQATVKLYCDCMYNKNAEGINQPGNMCAYTRVYNLSETAGDSWFNKDGAKILEEARKRGYNPPGFDAVVFGIARTEGFVPSFNLDKILETYYISRFDPVEVKKKEE